MPAISSPATILVTGASGFIAVHVIQAILDQGFSVIGTVRSSSKGEYLFNLFDQTFPGKFSFVVIEDIQKDGAFDQVVKGVDAVEHTASPFHVNGTDPQDYYGPAIQGTLGILNSVLKYGTSVKRVVVTSSTSSIVSPKTGPYVFTESDWNDSSPAIVEREGKNAPPDEMYSASKTLAEKAAWEFMLTHQDEIAKKWDLVTLLPPYVFGPIIHQTTLESLNTSSAMFHSIVLSSPDPAQLPKEELIAPHGSWIDVRDIALAHALVLSNKEAGGERFIISAGGFTWQHCYAINSSKTPLKGVNVGYPGTASPAQVYSSGDKAAKVLGIKYRDLETMGVDTVNSLRARFPELTPV